MTASTVRDARRVMERASDAREGSRLRACPVCGKSTHVALIHAHVERCLERAVASTGGAENATARASAGVGGDDGERGVASMCSVESRSSGEGGWGGGGVRALAAAARAREEEGRDVGTTGGKDFRDFKRRRALADATNGGVFASVAGDAVARAPRRADASTQTEGASTTHASGEEEDVDVEKAVEDLEGGEPCKVSFELRVMSGNHEECGICLTPFDDAGVTRHVFYPCQHVRQCGDCALRVWQVPKAKRRCPWCKSKIEIRPRAFKPFL